MRERDVEEPGLRLVASLCVFLDKSIPCSVGRVWGPNFILSQLPPHSNIPATLASFFLLKDSPSLVFGTWTALENGVGGSGWRGESRLGE